MLDDTAFEEVGISDFRTSWEGTRRKLLTSGEEVAKFLPLVDNSRVA